MVSAILPSVLISNELDSIMWLSLVLIASEINSPNLVSSNVFH